MSDHERIRADDHDPQETLARAEAERPLASAAAFGPADVFALQSAIGNRAVGRWLSGLARSLSRQPGQAHQPVLARDDKDKKEEAAADATQPVSLSFSYERLTPSKGKAPAAKTDTAGSFDITLFPHKNPRQRVTYSGINAAGGDKVMTPDQPVLEGPGKADGHLTITPAPKITASLNIAAKYKSKDYGAIAEEAAASEQDPDKKASAGQAAAKKAQEDDKKHVAELTAKFNKRKSEIESALKSRLKTARVSDEAEIESELSAFANEKFAEFDKEIKVDVVPAPDKGPATPMVAKGDYPAIGPTKKSLDAKAEINVEPLISDRTATSTTTTKKEDEQVFSEERLRKEVHLEKSEKVEQNEETLKTIAQAHFVKTVADQAIQHDFTKKDFNWNIGGSLGGGARVGLAAELKDVPLALAVAVANPELGLLIAKLFPGAGKLSLKVDGSGEIHGELKGAIDSKSHEEHENYKKHESTLRQEFASSVAHEISHKVTTSNLKVEGKMEESAFKEWVRKLSVEEKVVGTSVTTHDFDERVKDSVVRLNVS